MLRRQSQPTSSVAPPSGHSSLPIGQDSQGELQLHQNRQEFMPTRQQKPPRHSQNQFQKTTQDNQVTFDLITDRYVQKCEL